jgi:4-carboxymuconolactone decarboxylase
MARLPEVKREDIAPGMQYAYDEIAGSRGAVRGPFAMLLHSPDVAARIAHAGAYIRFETTLDAKVRELAILTVARHWDCQYEFTAHQPIAEREGVRPETITAVRDRTAPAGLDQHESLIFTYVSELLANKRVPQATFDAVRAWLGDRSLMDLSATTGYYSMLACVLDACAVVPEEGVTPLLPNAPY